MLISNTKQLAVNCQVPELFKSGWSWRRDPMKTFSASLAFCAGNSPVTGEFSTQRPVTRSFNVFFDLRLNIRLSKQSWCWWFETLSRSLWRHCNVLWRLYVWDYFQTPLYEILTALSKLLCHFRNPEFHIHIKVGIYILYMASAILHWFTPDKDLNRQLYSLTKCTVLTKHRERPIHIFVFKMYVFNFAIWFKSI